MGNKILTILYIIFYFLLVNKFSFSTEVKIIKKINNEIITNLDIQKEYNYLVALNNDLINIKKEEALKIAENSLTREKIKEIEIKRFYNLDNQKNETSLNKIFETFYKKLGLANELEFESYLKSYGLNLNEVREKIQIEISWNRLIGEKFRNQIEVDVEKIKKKIEEKQLNIRDVIEYDLSEILFQAKNSEELKSKINDIKLSINQIGFNNTANKYSISDSAKFGGKIGKIKQNQLSEKIKNELINLRINEITKPINIGGNFLILLLNGKEKIEIQQDKNQVLENLIKFERTKQFDMFSQIYFNKVKLNNQINAE